MPINLPTRKSTKSNSGCKFSCNQFFLEEKKKQMKKREERNEEEKENDSTHKTLSQSLYYYFTYLAGLCTQFKPNSI